MKVKLVVTLHITASVNLDVSRDDVITVDESAALETDLTVTSVHTEDHSELCPIEASVHRDFHLSTEHSPSAKLVKNDSTCSLSAEKVNKLELMQRGSCHYNEVRSLCTIYVKKNCSLYALLTAIKNRKNHKNALLT